MIYDLQKLSKSLGSTNSSNIGIHEYEIEKRNGMTKFHISIPEVLSMVVFNIWDPALSYEDIGFHLSGSVDGISIDMIQ